MELTEEQKKLAEENHNLIYWYIQMKHLDANEWYDLLAIELCYTVSKYNPEKGSLSNYFKMRADNLVKKEYSKSQLKKNKAADPLAYNDDIYNSGDVCDIEAIVDIEKLLEGDNGNILRMRAAGYTQAEIADRLGVTQSYISKIIEKKRKEYYGID